MFSCEICEILKNTFFIEHLQTTASVDQNGTCAALLADISVALGSLPHDLLIAKLHAYGYNLPSLKLL